MEVVLLRDEEAWVHELGVTRRHPDDVIEREVHVSRVLVGYVCHLVTNAEYADGD